MPVPASDSIASDVGHGALGVRYGLRPFRDLLSETVGQRHLWVELRPKKVLTTWDSAPGGGPPYTKAVAETFDGVVLDVVGVQTLTETLTRVDPGVAVVAGTYLYDGATLTIYLTADADPASTTVVAELGVHVGSHGVHQPVLLPDRLANGSLEAWTGTNPDGWTVVTGAGITLDKTTSDPLQGSYAARFTFAASLLSASLGQSFASLAAGGRYRVSGAYRVTCPAANISARLYVDDGAATTFIHPDGRTTSASSVAFEDAVGDGEWKRFAFDFICPSWATVRVRLYAIALSAATGTVDFDDVKLQSVSRYAYHEPLLSIDSVPTIEAARPDSFWGQMSSALGSLGLLNGNGLLEPLLAAYDWLGADAVVRVGGRFQLDGNETLLEDCPVIASGKLGAPTVTDSGVTFEMEDDRKILQRTLPARTYNNNGGTDAYQQRDRGRVRPLLFGTKAGIQPVQYDIHYTGGGPVPLGSYEVVDCTDWPAGLKEITTVHWYVDEGAATARSAVLRNAVPDYDNTVLALTLTTGRFDVLRDARPIIITEENNKLHFDIGGAVLTAVVTPGVYQMHAGYVPALTLDLGTAMQALGAGDEDCLFNAATQKLQLFKNAGTLNLRCATGADVQMGIWDVLGFDATADKTGALTYTADNVFTSQAYDQVLRVDAIGFMDDLSGTYTGSASATIEKAPDIAHFILRVLLGVPASAVDVPSFVAARAVADRPCSLYIGSERTVADIFAELETSGDMDLVLQGGVWYCLTRDTSVPAGTPELVDADFLALNSRFSPDDLYGTVVLTYNDSPDNPKPMAGGNMPWTPNARTEMGEATDATVALRYGRPDRKVFATCLRDAADATTNPARLQEIATQASTKRRRFRFATKGKALQVPVGGKLQLTRSRGLDSTGALSQVLVRVLSKRDDWARWVSEIEAIEVV